MIDAQRLKERMVECDISQAELGRRVGVAQTSIFKLVSGRSLNSRYLHIIARELQTTPAYLASETDDPDELAPTEPVLSYEERELVDCFGRLDTAERAALLQIARSMANKGRPSVHAPRRTFRSEGSG